jgi:ABC-type branched-subunit amino acid transport system permease subunit
VTAVDQRVAGAGEAAVATKPVEGAPWRATLGRYFPLLVLVGFLTWFGMAQSTDRFWITLGIQALWTAIAVIGLNILLGYTGLLSLGHYAFFLYGGFVGAIWTVQDWGLSPWPECCSARFSRSPAVIFTASTSPWSRSRSA